MNKAGFPLTSLGLSHFSRTKHHFPTLHKSLRFIIVILGVAGLALLSLAPAWAGDGALDPSFNPGVGADYVPTLWSQAYYNDSSGKSLVAGSFTEVGGVANRGVARLLADGSPDPSFTSPVATAWVNNCFLLNPADPNSKILISGPFEVPSSSGTYYGLARLNFNGTVDTSFHHTFGPCPGMSGFGVQTGGKLVVAGYALPVNGYPGTYYLLRLNANGTVDDSYPKRSGAGAYVWSAQAYPATDPTWPNCVRLLGQVPRFSDPTHLDYMVLLGADGNTVLSSLGDENINGSILQWWIQSDNKIVIVGDFDQVFGTSMNNVARLLSTGGLDPDFKIGSGANGYIKRVTVDTGNKPVLAGSFTSFNGTPCGYMVRLNYDGSVDNTFNSGGLGADDRIWTMFKWGNGWIIEGAFQSVNGAPRKCIANLAANGAVNTQYASFNLAHTGTSPTVYAIQDSPQGLYIGGYFSGYGGKYNARMARVNFDGTLDPSFKARIDGTVKSLRTQWNDGKVLVAGNFGFVNGYISRTGLARFNPDGSLDRAFNPIVTKADGSMPDLAMVDRLDNGQILIAGDFAQIADANHVMQPRTAIARLNADGTLDPAFNAQINIPGGINIRVNGGGEMDGSYPMVGYVFYSGSHCGFYTRLTSTGALDTTFGSSGGPAPHVNLFNGEVRCGTDTSDGRVAVGGDFTQMIDSSGSPPQVGRIAGFTANGLLDNTFITNPGANNPIYVLERQWPYNKILIGGAFTSYNGVVRNSVARMNPDGSLDNSFNPGTGANGPVYAIRWNDYIRKARIGGAFTTYDSVTRMRIAQIFAGVGSFNPAIPLLLMD